MQNMDEELVSPQSLKPIPKSHMFLHKLKRINLMDRQIRKKWADLQKINKQVEKKKISNMMSLEQLRKLHSEAILTEEVNEGKKPNNIIQISNSIKRQTTYLRKKHLQNIFYKKKSRNPRPEIHLSPLQSLKNSHKVNSPHGKMKTQGNENCSDIGIPLMLQKRPMKMDRQFHIINKKYKQQLKDLEKKEYRSEEKQIDSQKSMIKKIEGSKAYYRLVSSFSTQPSSY